jgi:hypothetical protein
MQVSDFPRINLAHLPTPLERMPQPFLLLDFAIGIYENSRL